MDNQSIKKHEQLNRNMFSRWSRWYDGVISRIYFEPLYRRIVSLIEEQGDSLVRACVLDVACGTGEVIYRLAQELPATKFIGVDFTSAMVEKAITKNKALSNVKFQIAEVNNLPFPDNSFKLVICSDAFHHFFSANQVMREMYRVIKPNGKLLLVDPAFNSAFLKFIGLIFKKIENAYAYYSAEELRKILFEEHFIINLSSKYHLNNFIIATKS